MRLTFTAPRGQQLVRTDCHEDAATERGIRMQGNDASPAKDGIFFLPLTLSGRPQP